MTKIQELLIASKMIRKSDDELNNLLFDIHAKYKIDDRDWMTIMAASAVITQRQVVAQMGLKNDAILGGGDSDVGST